MLCSVYGNERFSQPWWFGAGRASSAGGFLVEHDGLSQVEAARLVGVQRQAVNIWVRRYRAAGEDGLLDGRRVSPRRGKGLLSDAQCRQVRDWITDRTPDQLKLPFALWTARAVLELIEQRFGIRLGLSTMQLYLQRWV